MSSTVAMTSPGPTRGKEFSPQNNNADDNCCNNRIYQVPFTKKEQLRCLVCGGKDCSKCGLNAYKSLPNPAIKLLHSHWINDCIIGMQRPNDTALDNGALDDMVAKNITAIFNLTEPGEHPYCGTGVLDHSGFPYSPEKLMSAGVKHFNFSWKDMTTPPMQMMMDIVFIACNELNAGGKIAIHCHAGFGRTGITIACILIAKERLAASSVVQFIRNRRPGSVQTTAQQQFVVRFEKAYNFMMQIFPVMDESQQQFLKDSSSSSGGTGGSFRGLPAINPTPNSSVPPTPSTSPAIKPHLHDTNGRPHKKSVIFYSKTIGQSARDQHHFLSAAELATRRFNYSSKIVLLTTLAIGRLVHDNFHFACLAITGLTKLAAKNNTEVHTHGKSMVRPDQTIGISTKLIHKRSNFMVALNSLSASSEEGLLRDIKIDLNSNLWTRLKSYMDVVGTIIVSNDSISKLQNSNSIAKLNPNRSTKELSTADMNRDRSLTHLPSQSAKNNSDSKITDQSQKLSNESKDGEAKNESKNTTDYSGEDEVKLPPLNIGNGNKPALTSKPSMSNLMRLQKSISFTSPPGSPMMNPNANTTHNHHQSKISVTQLKRVNSLKQTSEADFSKSKKIASNIVSQLLLDWLETRQDPLFSSDAIAALTELWKEHGKNSNMDRFNTESAKSKEESGSLLEKKEDSFRQYDEANNASLDLYVDINKCLLANLDRFNLELLDSLVQMYVSVRSASRKWTEAAANDADGVMEGSSEADALEALVGLRFTIAMMHARKEHHALVRHRALLMDVVKVFLLKSAHSEIVLINNIAFTEDNYYQIENTLGPSLLCSLDVVFRTFRLLSDHQWSYSDHASAGKVGWRSDGDYFRVREDDDNCVRSFHSGDGSLVVEEGDVNGTNRSQSRAVKSVTSQSTEHASSDSDENPVDSK